ncbi:hypothetical protein ACFL6I_03040 [candidate division KSB1 bacterium]
MGRKYSYTFFALNRKRILFTTICTALLFLSAGLLKADDRGGYAGAFLRFGLGARAKALGGAFVGYPVDGYSGYYNPAGLTSLQHREVLFSYRDLSLDRTFHYIGFAAPLPPMAGLALGWIHAGVDKIDGRDFTGNHTEWFSDSQNGVLFGFGLRPAANFSVGIGGTYLRESLYTITATGFGLNLGVLYRPLPYLSLGLAVRDLGASYSWNTESLYELGSSTTDRFPTVVTGGTGLELKRYNSILLLDVFKNSKSEPGVRFGIENGTLEIITLRAGMDDGDFTAGAGIEFHALEYGGFINYAFGKTENDTDPAHIFSLRILF